MAILGTSNSDLHLSADLIYPVGSIYLTMADTSPADLFGGTWKKLSGGYLYANSSNAGNTGGSNSFILSTANLPAHTHSTPSHTHSIPSHTHSIPSHTHSVPSHTHSIPSHTHGYTRTDSTQGTSISGNQMPSHTHYAGRSNQGAGRTDWGLVSTGAHGGNVLLNPGNGSVDTGWTGGNGSHNHGINTSWVSTGNWSGTTGGTGTTTGATGGTSGSWNGTTGASSGTTGSTGSGTAITFYPEYINVYMWQRTA